MVTCEATNLFGETIPRRTGRRRALRAWGGLVAEARRDRPRRAEDAPLFALSPPRPAAGPCPVCGGSGVAFAGGAVRFAPASPEAECGCLDRWLARRGSPDTARAYRRDAAAFVDFLQAGGGLDALPALLPTVTRNRVRQWRDELQRRVAGGALAAATAKRRLAALVSLFDFLAERGLHAGPNPARKLWRPRSRGTSGIMPPPGGAMTAAERARLLATPPARASLDDLRDSALLHLCVGCGVRPGDAVRGRVADLKPDNGPAPAQAGSAATLRVHRRRPAGAATVGLDAGALSSLRRYLDAAGHAWDRDGALLRTLDGRRPLSAGAARDLLRRRVRRTDDE